MTFDMSAEVNTDAAEDFIESFLSEELKAGDNREVQEWSGEFRQWPQRQRFKIKLAEKLMRALSAFSDLMTSTEHGPQAESEESEEKAGAICQFNINMLAIEKSICIDLMEIYTDYLTRKYYEFDGSLRLLVSHAIRGFAHLKEEMGDENNSSVRYLEEALAQHLQEDEDFLGTYLRALQLINRDDSGIDTFSWIEGSVENELQKVLLYPDWKHLVLNPHMELFNHPVVREEVKGEPADESAIERLPAHWLDFLPEKAADSPTPPKENSV